MVEECPAVDAKETTDRRHHPPTDFKGKRRGNQSGGLSLSDACVCECGVYGAACQHLGGGCGYIPCIGAMKSWM